MIVPYKHNSAPARAATPITRSVAVHVVARPTSWSHPTEIRYARCLRIHGKAPYGRAVVSLVTVFGVSHTVRYITVTTRNNSRPAARLQQCFSHMRHPNMFSLNISTHLLMHQ